MTQVGAIIFHPATGPSSIENTVTMAKEASASDLIQCLSPLVSTTIVACSADAASRFQSLGASTYVVQEPEQFHFGETLKAIIRDHTLDALIYFGSGSGTLLSQAQLSELACFAHRADRQALFNNYYSCDFAVVTDAAFLLELPLPRTDNGLGFLLSDHGVRCFSLPRSLASQFDLDTPIDLLLLKESGRGGSYLRSFLASQSLVHAKLESLLSHLIERTSLVYLVGRVNPSTWQAFEQQVACRTAGMIEGRGMKAYADRHPAALATLLGQRGFSDFFSALEKAADAAIIDTRPLLARKGTLPTAHERFSCDLFQISEMEDPLWIDFAQRALDCSIPILLGGHSLVSGGLYLLSEICWKGRDLPRRLHPDPYEGDGSQHEPVFRPKHY